MSDTTTSSAAGTSSASSVLAIGAIASAAAAILHGTAAGVHAEHAGLSRIFLTLAVLQGAVAVIGFVRADRLACSSMFVVNAGAAVGWSITRLTGVSGITGLEVAERPGLADTSAAVLAIVAAGAAIGCAFGKHTALPGRALTTSAFISVALLVPGLADATNHDHDDHADHDQTEAAGHDHDETAAADDDAPPADDDHADDHGHGGDDDDTTATATASTGISDDTDHADHADDSAHSDHADDSDHSDHADQAAVDPATVWPRTWDPTGAIDFSGVPGVSAEQQARAEQLVVDTLRELPQFADVASLAALGYTSIGDASTGHEHYINRRFIGDDNFLDPTAPESLVFEVNGADRTLVSAMFIADSAPIDDPVLTEFAGPLMQWHVHDNLCWSLNGDGQAVVVKALDGPDDTCPAGSALAGGQNPMVHVWIAPHPCGPFAALEGHGAGQASVSEGARMDMCNDGHDGHGADDEHTDHAAAEPVPYDPEMPIDLGGTEGVTLQQQAFAENLVAITLHDLPKWADLDVVEAAGFHSIGDGATGHEHYIQWDWIEDDVWLDPDYPESLVFEPQPDGSKKLVSAMYMLPSDVELADVPDWGGELMQWHVHGDLCFTDDPVAPQVAGIKPLGTSCAPPLVDMAMAPMIHVWITPHECGPFAALDGIAGGQVPEGEETLCDDDHGSH